MKKLQNKFIATIIVVTILISNCYALLLNVVYASSTFNVTFEGAFAGNGEQGYQQKDVIYYEFDDSYIDHETQELVDHKVQVRARVQEINGQDAWYCPEVFSTNGDNQIATLVVEDTENVNDKYKINFDGDITSQFNVFVNDEKITGEDLIIANPIPNDDYTITIIDREITDGMTIRLEKRELKYITFNSNPILIDSTTVGYTDGENEITVQVGTRIDDGEGGYTFTPVLLEEKQNTYIDEHGDEQTNTHIEAELETETLENYYFFVSNPNVLEISAWINGNEIPEEWAKLDQADSTKAWVSLAQIVGDNINVDFVVRNADADPGPGHIAPPEIKAGYITANMEVAQHASGQINYFFVNAQGKYLDAEGNVLTEQKEPAGEIRYNDELKESLIPGGTVKVLIGLDSGRNSDFYNIVRYYNEHDFEQIEKDDVVHGNTIEIEYNANDSIAIALGIEYRDEGFYPEEKGSYLITDFRGNDDAFVKYIDSEDNEQTLTNNTHSVENVISIPKMLTMQITEEQLDNLHIDIYDENLELLTGETGDIALLLADEEDETKNFDAWITKLINGEKATLDLSSLNSQDYTFVINLSIKDPHEAEYAHVLTWTNMKGSGWPDDALIDGGFARIVKAYDKDDNLIYDINEEYDESHYMVDDRGNVTNKYIYGDEMPFEWERGPMYPFAIVQDNDGGEVEAVEGIKLVVELSPVYGKQLVGVSLGESIGEAEEVNARYYELTMPARHTHFNAQFAQVDNESLIGENTAVSSVTYVLDDKALDSGSAVLSIDKVENLSNEQKQAFAEEAGINYSVSNYLDVDLTQVWFKGTDATFNQTDGYSDEEVWKKEIYDLGNKKATITITLDEGISPDDVIILHELHDDQGRSTGYEKVTITSKSKNTDGIWTITFTTSKFSNYAIATKKITNYTITFNTNGGSVVTNQIVQEGSRVSKPATPTKEGYAFEGWYSDSKCLTKFDFTKEIKSNTTIYARWNQIYKDEFKDVKTTKWYYNAVKYCFENNIMSGLNETSFGPSDKLTRGMMVTILYRMEGSPKITTVSSFTDVKDSKKYYYKAAVWAANNKIVSGYEDGRFGPADNITREQLAVILWKYAKYKKKDVSKTDDLSGFTDSNKVASYATKQVKWAVATGVINGSNGKLNPKGNATRAEVAAMMEKYCKKVGR